VHPRAHACDDRRRARARTGALLALIAALLGLAAMGAGRAAAATFAVDSTQDRIDVNGGDGVCAAGDGSCTLRAAIQEANELAGPDTIQVPAGTFALAIPAASGDHSDGDLDITGPLAIDGAGSGATLLDGTLLDRLVEVHPTAGDVTLSGLTVRSGASEEDGGGIFMA
jgi:CSLREA domain-containing protein